MVKCTNGSGRTKGANEKSIVLVHQHSRDDVTCKPPIVKLKFATTFKSFAKSSLPRKHIVNNKSVARLCARKRRHVATKNVFGALHSR